MKYAKIGFLLFAFFLPLSTKLSNIFLILSLILSLCVVFLSKASYERRFSPKALKFTTIGIFLLILIGIFYTENREDSFGHIERSISFLLVPLIFFFAKGNFVIDVEKYLIRGILMGTIVSSCYLLSVTLLIYFSKHTGWQVGTDLFDYYHTNKYFTEPVDIHPNYLGVYILTALLFINNLVTKRLPQMVITSILVLTIIFLNARSIFLCGLLLILFFYVRRGFSTYRNKNFSWILPRILIVSLFLAFSVLLISKTYIGYRIGNIFKVEISTKSEENFNSKNSANPRLARWESAYNAFKKSFIFGHGTAAEKQVLQRQFYKDGLTMAADLKYDAHNQFLGFAVRFGIIGIGVLMFFFISNFTLAISTKNHPYAFLIVMLGIICLTENYLDRNYGITYVAVFFTTFTLNCYTLKEKQQVAKHPEK